MSDFKGHKHGEYDDECPICYLDRIVEEQQEKIERLRALLYRWHGANEWKHHTTNMAELDAETIAALKGASDD